jgi:hypothetical protein
LDALLDDLTLRLHVLLGPVFEAYQARLSASEAPAFIDEALARARDAVQLASAHFDPEAVTGLRQFLLDVARRTAAAAKEGGFLGLGGTHVSPAEQEALQRLAAALELPADDDPAA